MIHRPRLLLLEYTLSGFYAKNPILKRLDNIKQMDAILAFDANGKPVEPEWPEAGQQVVQQAVVSGEVASTISHYAGSSGTDLIVMASHGRSGLARLVLGSIA